MFAFETHCWLCLHEVIWCGSYISSSTVPSSLNVTLPCNVLTYELCVFYRRLLSHSSLEIFGSMPNSRLLANYFCGVGRVGSKELILYFLLFSPCNSSFCISFMRQDSQSSQQREWRRHWKDTFPRFILTGTKLFNKLPLQFSQLEVGGETALAAFGWQTLTKDDICLLI